VKKIAKEEVIESHKESKDIRSLHMSLFHAAEEETLSMS